MKKFLFRLFNLLVVLFIVSAILQLIISIRIKNKTLFGSDNLYTVKNQKNDIVFLGSSRCYCTYDPRFFHDSLGVKSVNLGIEGHQDIAIHMIRLEYYLKYNPPPKLVLISFDPFMNAGSFNEQKEFTRKDYFSRYAFLPNDQDKAIVEYFHFNLIEKYVPLYALLKYNLLLKSVSPYKKTEWETIGFAENNHQWDTISNPYSYTGALKSYNAFTEYYDSIKTKLQSLNNLCKQKNIKLVCVEMPVYKGIYNKDAFDVAKKMCDESGIAFINTNESYIIDNPENFADQFHLNSNGVPLTMNIIIRDKNFIAALRN